MLGADNSPLNCPIERIVGNIPPSLESALNYEGSARWVAIYRDENIAHATGLEITLYDGRSTHAGDINSWKLFADKHPSLRSHFETLTPTNGADVSADALLLDRKDRNLYKCPQTAIEGFLANPKAQKLLLELDYKRPKHFDRYRVIAFRAGIGLVAAAILGVVGYGAYQGASHLHGSLVVIQPTESSSSSNSQSEVELKSQADVVKVMDNFLQTAISMFVLTMGLGVVVMLISALQKQQKQ